MLEKRSWVPEPSELYVASISRHLDELSISAREREIHTLIETNHRIYREECVNLNPAGNVMNPKAEFALAAGLGSRPSLGYPGDKYEMGLEAVEKIEVITAHLAAETFGAKFAEVRVPSGAIANLYVFMATCQPGDHIIAPPASIGGHVTHHRSGCAGLYGLVTHAAPVDPLAYTVDVEALRKQAHRLRPKLITIGGSLNLFAHPVREMRAIADEVGAYLLFDAAHLCGMIAGRAWQQPLDEGAHAITMSTYKSLGGPPSGLIVTNDAELARSLDTIAYPGLTANFDVAKSASLALSLLDWQAYGKAYAEAMAKTAHALAEALEERGIPVFANERGSTASHQFAVEAAPFGGGHKASKLLRNANILTSGIGLPIDEVAGDMNGIRLGTPEIVRWGMSSTDMPELASYIAEVLTGIRRPELVAADVTSFRQRFSKLHFVRP